ncbi:MAG: sugar phosphate isomerase/epimerase family protein [Mycobacteriales bacterium]
MSDNTAAERCGLSRRGFLGAAAGVVGGVALASASGAVAAGTRTATEVVTRDKLGVQLWTCLAEYEADTPETLSLIAQMGYTYVEYAFGYGSLKDAKSFRKALDDTGLWCNGGHDLSPYPYNDKAWKQHVEDTLVIGAPYLGHNTTFPTTYSECMKYVDAVHKGHDVARRMGFRGFLFNHMEAAQWAALKDRPSQLAVELVLKHTSHDVWNAELDTAHALAPLGSIGAVIRMIRKHPGRFPFLHMKDGVGPVFMPDGSYEALPLNGTEFGTGDFGRPDPSDTKNRPHAGFQDVLTAIRETHRWPEVLLIAESDGSQATCVDYSELAFKGLNGLRFPYRTRR